MLIVVIESCQVNFLPQVLTKDSVTVSVDAVVGNLRFKSVLWFDFSKVYYRVSNATISVANVENAHHSTRLQHFLHKTPITKYYSRLLAQTTLRNILGTKTLHEILSDREGISGRGKCLVFYLTLMDVRSYAVCFGWSHWTLGNQGGEGWNVGYL